jgi:hypothetical protein
MSVCGSTQELEARHDEADLHPISHNWLARKLTPVDDSYRCHAATGIGLKADSQFSILRTSKSYGLVL